MTQLMAVRSGIDTVGALILDLHLGACITTDDSTHRIESLRDSMRMWWRFAPGAETTWHRHSYDYVVVPLTTGKLQIDGDLMLAQRMASFFDAGKFPDLLFVAGDQLVEPPDPVGPRIARKRRAHRDHLRHDA